MDGELAWWIDLILVRTCFAIDVVPDQITLMGSTIPLPAMFEKRRPVGKPRRLDDERYPNRESFLNRIIAVATEMVVQGYVLAEDVPSILSASAKRWDGFYMDPSMQ